MLNFKKTKNSFMAFVISVILAIFISFLLVCFLKLFIISNLYQLLLIGILFLLILFYLLYWLPDNPNLSIRLLYPTKIIIIWWIFFFINCCLLIVLLPSELHTIEIIATGQKNKDSKASEVWVLEGDRYADTLDFSGGSSWEKRQRSLVSYKNQPARLYWRGRLEYETKLLFLKHPWSGIVEVIYDGKSQKYDLYSAKRSHKQVVLNEFPIGLFLFLIGCGTLVVAISFSSAPIKYFLKFKEFRNVISVQKITNCIISVILLLAIIIPFLLQIYNKYLHLDFWYDEVTTLYRYTFCPLSETVMNYSSTNNHILFNLINNLYLKLINVESLFTLMDQPEKSRYFILAFSLISFIYLYKIGTEFFNTYVAYIALVILVTTVPFFNFAVQQRGYSLSMMFIFILIYHLWCFEKKFRWIDVVMIIFTATLLLYTILLNLYVLCAIFIFYSVAGVKNQIKNKKINEENHHAISKGNINRENDFYIKYKYYLISFMIFISIYISSVLYLPHIRKILNFPYTKSLGIFNTDIIYSIMPNTLLWFLSERYGLLVLALFGITFCIIEYNRKTIYQDMQKCLFCFTILFTPFILSFIRGDMPLSRIFLNLIPVYVLLVSICIHFFFFKMSKFRFNKALFIISIVLYCQITFVFALTQKNNKLMSDIKRGHKSQNIYYNYYQAYYNPSKLIMDFKQKIKINDYDIFAWRYDLVALPKYLAKYQVTWDKYKMEDPVKNNKGTKFYVFTSYPFTFKKEAVKKYPAIQCKKVNNKLSFHNIFQCNY